MQAAMGLQYTLHQLRGIQWYLHMDLKNSLAKHSDGHGCKDAMGMMLNDSKPTSVNVNVRWSLTCPKLN